MSETPVQHLARLHDEERSLRDLLKDAPLSPERRRDVEELLRLNQQEITEIVDRNADAASAA